MVILGKTKSKSPDKLTLARTLVNAAVPQAFCARRKEHAARLTIREGPDDLSATGRRIDRCSRAFDSD